MRNSEETVGTNMERVMHVKQMAVLTARNEDLLKTLPYVEEYMPFITELLLCSPSRNKEDFFRSYTGNLNIIFVSDEELLAGRDLPEDHSKRNFYLRCLMMRLDCLDDIFVMSDDDYRPLVPMTEEEFLSDGQYIGYYFYDLRYWEGTYGAYSSFDKSEFRTLEFLEEHGYPTLQYASHQPQIIDKNIFKEMIVAYPGIENAGYQEWCIYFNYLAKCYPEKLLQKKYTTLGWPGALSDWKLYVKPEQYHFENYYESLYEKGGIFEGFSKELCGDTSRENVVKIRRYEQESLRQIASVDAWERYRRVYQTLYKTFPFVYVYKDKGEGKLRIHLPQFIIFYNDCFMRVPFTIDESVYENLDDNELQVGYQIVDTKGKVITASPETRIYKDDYHVLLPVHPPKKNVSVGCILIYARIRLHSKHEAEKVGFGRVLAEAEAKMPCKVE